MHRPNPRRVLSALRMLLTEPTSAPNPLLTRRRTPHASDRLVRGAGPPWSRGTSSSRRQSLGRIQRTATGGASGKWEAIRRSSATCRAEWSIDGHEHADWRGDIPSRWHEDSMRTRSSQRRSDQTGQTLKSRANGGREQTQMAAKAIWTRYWKQFLAGQSGHEPDTCGGTRQVGWLVLGTIIGAASAADPAESVRNAWLTHD